MQCTKNIPSHRSLTHTCMPRRSLLMNNKRNKNWGRLHVKTDIDVSKSFEVNRCFTIFGNCQTISDAKTSTFHESTQSQRNHHDKQILIHAARTPVRPVYDKRTRIRRFSCSGETQQINIKATIPPSPINIFHFAFTITVHASIQLSQQ